MVELIGMRRISCREVVGGDGGDWIALTVRMDAVGQMASIYAVRRYEKT